MLLESNMLQMPTPSNQTYEALYNIFWNKNSDALSDQTSYPMLDGASANILEHKADLMALRRVPAEDRLTKILRIYFPLFFSARKPGMNGRVIYISERKIDIFVNGIIIFLAAAFLFGAICTLYYVQGVRMTLGLVTGYTMAFAMSIGLLTNARRAEIFGFCAAYAAVLVVFVSGNLGNGKNCCGAQT
jgi:hypothetical protein